MLVFYLCTQLPKSSNLIKELLRLLILLAILNMMFIIYVTVIFAQSPVMHPHTSLCVVYICLFSYLFLFHRSMLLNISVVLMYFMLQIRGMHTLIRDHEISTTDFVFYSDRLIRLVLELFVFL